MSLMMKIVKKVAPFIPDKKTDPLIEREHDSVGKPVSRVDGRLKVRGEATFSAEYKLENLVHAALVFSTITKGKITKINSSKAEKAAGVIAVITHENAPQMNKPQRPMKGLFASDLPIMRDAKIHWNGQPVAIVVAETPEQAEHAASLIEPEYESEAAAVSFDELRSKAEIPADLMGNEPEVSIGRADTALADSEFRIDEIYRTPRHNHNAIEPHATIAVWSDDDASLTVYDGAQYLAAFRNSLADLFGLAQDKVRVVAPFVGGAFGGKVAIWNHTAICAAAARIVKRPVKLVLSREGVYRVVGGRTLAEHRVAVGAKKNGKFTAIIHHTTSATTAHNQVIEELTGPLRHLYAAKNIHALQKSVYLDTVANTWMRAPGEATGTFALESAIDEIAYKLKIDPIELRRINEPERDPTSGKKFSMRNLTECYRRGAEKFGWEYREPRSQKSGKWLVGQGAATAFYPHLRMPATARVRISADNCAVISAAAHEMGMGTATVQVQHAAERLGLPIDRVSFEYGDSKLPESAMAGGACQTVSVVASVTAAIEKVHRQLLALAAGDKTSPLAGLKYKEIEARSSSIFSKKDSSKGETYSAILSRANREFVEAEATSGQPLEILKYSMHSYGAQFCEVRVSEESGEVRVSRWLGAFDCGKILNPKTATSQFRGSIVMGIGMALAEETLFDERCGRIMNPSLAEYHVPVHLDIPPIEIIYTDIPDKLAPLGAHGVGEIGITGVAAAIANAVFNATGKRVRELPITLDKLL